VRQEIWDLPIAYNLLRWEMHQTANELGVPPVRVGFQGLSRAIVAELRHAPLETPALSPNDSRGYDNKPAPIGCLHDDNDRVRVRLNGDITDTPRKMPVRLTDWH